MRQLRPAEITAFALFFLYALAVALKASVPFFQAEVLRFCSIALGMLLPFIIQKKILKQRISVENGAITLAILLLLADTTTVFWQGFALGAVTVAAKSLIRVNKVPVFNPAALSLWLFSFVGVATTWWGVSFAPRFTSLELSSALLYLVPVGLYIVWKYQKIPTMVATVVAASLSFLVLTGGVPVRLFFDGTFLFFLWIMATEPKTTPLLDKHEWVYGVLLGASVAVWLVWQLPLPYLSNLLLLNAAFSLYKWWHYSRVKAV